MSIILKFLQAGYEGNVSWVWPRTLKGKDKEHWAEIDDQLLAQMLGLDDYEQPNTDNR